ncbi:unnamed protein product [Rotaria sp. Silwood1]|nr:unnamed protein product [Rotaria sp. Silwood1]
MSRSTPPVASSFSSLNDINMSFDHDTLNLHQNQDSAIQVIKNVSPLNPKYTLDDYNILYEIITRKNGHVLQLPYVPASLTPQVLLMYHNSTFSGGHFDIERHILSCINCRKNKPSRRKPDGHLHPIEPPRGVWERLAMNYVGPVSQSKSANGQCERHNATLVANLVALSNQSRSNWDDKLVATSFNYNVTRHDSTGYTPFELMFARQSRFVADLSSSFPSSSHTVSHYYHTMQQFIEYTKIAARQNNLRHQQSSEQRYDQNRSNPRYSVGQSVLVRNRNPHINKFSPRFVGPYAILDQLHDKTYVVPNDNTSHQVQVPVHDIRSLN